MTLNNINQYGTAFQTKVIAALLNDKSFLINIHDILSDEYFEAQSAKWIINESLAYFSKYHCPPTMEVLAVELKKLKNEVVQISIKELLHSAYQASEKDLDYVKEEFFNFCKNQQLKKALLSSVDLLQAGDYDAIRYLVDSALKSGQDKNIGHEYNKDLESRYRQDQRSIVPTPWNEFNELLQGGLGNGDLGLLFGSPGGGKSWSLVALGGHAVKMGYNVIHYTLELREDYVGKRYDSFFTQIPVNEIHTHKEKVQEVTDKLQGNLIIKQFPTGKATISTLEAHIEKCINQEITPDLVIIDYIDLLRSKKNTRERKDEIDDIYIGTKGLAAQLDIPIWSVSQVNRAGAKDDIIEGDKAAGSYDKIMITDFAVSLSRKKEDKQNGTGRLHIMKNRYGMDGMTFGAQIDTGIGKFELVDLDSIPTPPSSTPDTNGFSQADKEHLNNQFFNLNNE